MKLQRVCDVIFVIFAIMFYLTRWVYYPYVALVFYLRDVPTMLGYYGASVLFTILVSILQVLHIYWGFLIARMIYQFAVVGKVEKDTRSEDESSGDEREQKFTTTNNSNSNNKSRKKKQ